MRHDGRLIGRDFVLVHGFAQTVGLRQHHGGRGGIVLHQRRILTRHLVQLRNGIVNLADAALCSRVAAAISATILLTLCAAPTIS